MRLLPAADNIYVKPLEEKQGAVFVPPVFRRKNSTALRGVVKFAGPRSLVAVDDCLLFNKWEDNEVEVNGEKLLLINKAAIIAVE